LEYRKREKLIASSVVVCGLAVQFLILPNFIDSTEEYELMSLSPSFFPSLAVWLITSLGGLYLLFTFFSVENIEDKATTEKWLSAPEEWKSVLCILLIIGYFIALNLVGFVPGTVLILAVLLPFQGVRGAVKISLISILAALGIHLFFLYVLKVYFPRGVLFE
jgi:hypothetical protein